MFQVLCPHRNSPGSQWLHGPLSWSRCSGEKKNVLLQRRTVYHNQEQYREEAKKQERFRNKGRTKYKRVEIKRIEERKRKEGTCKHERETSTHLKILKDTRDMLQSHHALSVRVAL
jgi:hypothetical protein